MIGLIKKELTFILQYLFVFIICIMFVITYLQFLLFTSDILLTVQKLNESDISVLKWLLYTFEILKILIVLELAVFIKQKKCGSILIFLIGSCMCFLWLYHATTDYYLYMDYIIAFLQNWILYNGIILSLFASVSQVILLVLYIKKKR